MSEAVGSEARTFRILLVEDDEDDYFLVETLLRDARDPHFELCWGRSFDEGLSFARGREHDAILVDYRLGVQDGVDLIRALRADGLTAPVVLLTANDEREIDDVAMGAGAEDFLPKRDLSAPLLERTIRHAIERTRAREALRRSEERQRAITRVTRDLVYEWDLTTGKVTRSDPHRDVFGHPPDPAIEHRRWWAERVHPDDRARLGAQLRELDAHRRENWFDEYRFHRADGSWAHVLNRAVVVRDREGKAQRIVGVLIDVTDRRRMEEELSRSEEKYRQIVEAALEGIWLLDGRGRTLYANRRMGELLGVRAEELHGREFLEFVAEADREIAERRLGRRLRGLAEKHELRLKRSDGAEVWAIVSATPTLDDAGRTTGALKLITDITDRKRAEQERLMLLERERSARRVAEVLQRVSTILSEELEPERLYQRIADEGTAATGAELGAFFRGANARAVPGPVAVRVRGAPGEIRSHLPILRAAPLLAATFEQGEAIRCEDARVHPLSARAAPGSGLPEELRSILAVPVRARSGEIAGVLVFGHREAGAFLEEHERIAEGIAAQASVALESARLFQEALTARATLEEQQRALLRSEARYRTLVKATSQIVWTRTGDGHGLGDVTGWTNFTGQSAEEQAGLGWLEALHPEERARVQAAWEQALGARAPFQVEVRISRREGGYAEAVLRAAPVLHESGEPREWVGSIVDVTERNQLQRKVQIADRMASIGTLAAGVAHEINNPLASIALNLAFATESVTRGGLAASPEVQQALIEARDAVDRVRHIVRDLRTFCREDDEQKATVDPRQAIESALHMARHEIRHRALVVTDYGETPLVEASGSRLGQVVLNLLVNAAQAIPEGAVDQHRITIETRTDERGWAMLEIEDTGVGIPFEIQGRIFDAFFTTKPIGMGTGLGLPICHQIVTALGGEITFDSEPGRGTRFRVALPPAIAAAPAPGPAPVRAAAPPTRRGRVLVIDDEPIICSALQRLLRAEHDVLVCTNASDALALIEDGERFDVVLCDLMMPRMTGMDLHDALAEGFPEVRDRMVFLTGGAFTARAIAFFDRVDNPKLEKPVDGAMLRALLRERIRD